MSQVVKLYSIGNKIFMHLNLPAGIGIFGDPDILVDISNRSPTMNQEEDEDAFLYGDTTVPATSKPPGSSAPADQEIEPASEEGEVDDEEEEEESDSVLI